MGRTTSSARDPLAALLHSWSTLTRGATLVALLAACAVPALTQPVPTPRFPIVFAPFYDSPSQFVARSPAGVTILTGEGIVLPGGARLQFLGANRRVKGEGMGLLPSVTNYVIGRDERQWRLGVANFSGVLFRSIYPGVDLLYHGEEGNLEFDLVVSPGADPSRIRMTSSGLSGTRLDSHGDIVVQESQSTIRQMRPRIYQETGGRRKSIAGAWRLDRDGLLRFEIGPYDVRKPLVIDPVVIYSTYIGGSGNDFMRAVGADAAGNAYVVGSAFSADFPGAPLSNSGPPQRGFVLKLNPEGTRLIYATVFGGKQGYGTSASGLAVDSGGNAYVTGSTESADFPVTGQAFQKALHGFSNAFVMKLDDAGVPLYSSFLGGGQLDAAQGIAVDSGGNAYVAGNTSSADFPVTPGAFQTAENHNPIVSFATGFLAKIAPNGDALVYSTYLGGSGSDGIAAVAVDSAGSAVVTGITTSGDFPVTPGALQGTIPSPTQNRYAFITKFNPPGSGLVYSTYLGGTTGATGNAVAMDPAGNTYAGCNSSVLKLDTSGSLIYAKDVEGGVSGLALDVQGDVFATGSASSSFLITPNCLLFRRTTAPFWSRSTRRARRRCSRRTSPPWSPWAYRSPSPVIPCW